MKRIQIIIFILILFGAAACLPNPPATPEPGEGPATVAPAADGGNLNSVSKSPDQVATATVGPTPDRGNLNSASKTPDQVATAAVAPTPDGRNLQPQLANANIDLNEVVALLPPDAIPAILPDEVSDIMVTADEADAAGMNPAARVIGVEINGESRAYPIPFMSQHEIVNDEVGGQLIAATW